MSIPTYPTYADFARATGKQVAAGRAEDVSADRIEGVWTTPDASAPFRTGYFTVVLIEQGRGRYVIDGTEYPTRPGTVYFTNPGHVKAFAYDAPTSGWVLTFTEGFLKEHARADVFGDLPFLLAESAPPFYADPATFAALSALAEQIAAETARPSEIRDRLVAALLVVFLLRFREAFWDGYDPVEEGDRGSAIIASFRRDLEAALRALVAGETAAAPSVADLAEAQGLHPNYLSTVVKAKTDRTVGEWTAEKLVAEARGLLSGSRASVKEVAYRLGFSEPTAFSRFFKRETGQTPTAFQHHPRVP